MQKMNGYLTQMASKRLSWLDDAKMFAMLSVILSHCYPINLIGVDTVGGIIVSFNMQLFMFLAGYTSAKSLECISDWNLYWHYIVKIALHLLLPSYAIGALQALITLDPAAISNEQWFLKMLFRYLLVFASVNWLAMELNKRLNKDGISGPLPLWLSIFRYILFAVLMFVLSKTKLPEFAFYFLTGYLLKKHKFLESIVSSFNSRSFMPIMLSTQITALFLTIFTWHKCYGYNFYDEPFWALFEKNETIIFVYRQICGFGWIILLVPLFILFSKKYTLFSYWGSKSLGLYITHTFIIHTVIERFDIVYPNDWRGWSIVIAITILLTIASMLLIKLFESNRYTHFLFLGGGMEVLNKEAGRNK